MKLIARLDVSDWQDPVSAILLIEPDHAKRLLALREMFLAQKEAMKPETLLDFRLLMLDFDPLPECRFADPDKYNEIAGDYHWHPLPSVDVPEAPLCANDEPTFEWATTYLDEYGIRLKAEYSGGDDRVSTPTLDWHCIEQIAAGLNPFEAAASALIKSEQSPTA